MKSQKIKQTESEIRVLKAKHLSERDANTESVVTPTKPRRFITHRETSKRTSLSRSTIYAYQNAGKFPKSYRVGDKAVRLLEDEVEEWIKQKLQK
jgi:prophage regulatory protein